MENQTRDLPPWSAVSYPTEPLQTQRKGYCHHSLDVVLMAKRISKEFVVYFKKVVFESQHLKVCVSD